MGEIETFLDKQKDITVHTVTGEITAEELILKIEEYYSGESTKSILWDFTEASLEKITPGQVREIAEFTKERSEIRRGGKTALVFGSDLGFGLGRMFDTFQEIGDSKVEHMAFRDKQKAMEWLNSDS